jgi:hypothetical protein
MVGFYNFHFLLSDPHLPTIHDHHLILCYITSISDVPMKAWSWYATGDFDTL